jgi:hypothetical protein
MKKYLWNAMVTIIFLFSLFFCYVVTSYAVNVGGTLECSTGTVTWTPDNNPYIVTSSVTVSAGCTLIIEPGTVVKFNPGFYLRVYGTLNAEGTEVNPIQFTSNATTPARGNWSQILFEGAGSGTISDCEILYATNGIVASSSATPVVTNSTIAHCNDLVLLSLGSKISLSGNTYTDSLRTAIIVSGGSLYNNWTLSPQDGLAYLLSDSLDVEVGYMLTLNPGTVFKFYAADYLRVYGTLNADGTIFTSHRDDAHGGDSTGDGATTPAPQDWLHIQFASAGSGNLDDCQIVYATDGIYCSSTSPIITSCAIAHNVNGINISGDSNPQINLNVFCSNTQCGVNNDGINMVSCANNWWGNSSGPTNPSNPGGTGDAVCGDAVFTPWRTLPNPANDIDNDGFGDICDDECIDPDGDEYGNPGFPSTICPLDNCSIVSNPGQEDTYPPDGNGCGDACECEGNFDGDADQDGTDAFTFKQDFGRSRILNPCTNADPCHGDFLCNGNVDGTDAFKFKTDFGRSALNNRCPINCVRVPWCNY